MFPTLLLIGAALAASPAEDAARVAALDTPSARAELVRTEMSAATEREDKARWMAALAVLNELAGHGVDGPQTLEVYLAWALSEEAERRNLALEAARAGGALDADGDPTVPPRPDLGAEALAPAATADPAKAGALASYEERWLSVGAVVYESTPSMTVPVGGAGPINTITVPTGPTTETTRWTVYQGGDDPLMMKGFRKALEGFGIAASEKGGGLVQNVIELEEAKVLTRRHNDALRAELGLTEDDVMHIELNGPDMAFSPGTVVK